MTILADARITGVGTAVPKNSYTQRELLDIFAITDPKVRSVFLGSAIERRFLTLPPEDGTERRVMETQGQLLAKHKRQAIDMGAQALLACLKASGAQLSDLEYLSCVTTTGFLTPGLSALIIRELGIDPSCHRVDVVGMGCNAGLNALNGTTAWATAHPGRLAVMICTEACSAAYVMDGTMRTAVVNSLFGDGAAAVSLVADPADNVADPSDKTSANPSERTGAVTSDRTGSNTASNKPGGTSGDDRGDGTAHETTHAGPRIVSFASHLITDAIDAMRYDWNEEQGKFSFFLDPEIPYVVGANAEQVVDRLLRDTGLRRSQIKHWLVHSGGKKVIDAVRVNLGLTRHDVRHTSGVLRDYGNLSSGSFLFSYERLVAEGVTAPGDYGVLMTMGPGSTIETALVQW